MIWKDITSYSRGERNNTAPRVWELKVGKFSLRVHRHIYHPPTQWLATCHGLFDCKDLKHTDLEDAKLEAIDLFKDMLQEALDVFK